MNERINNASSKPLSDFFNKIIADPEAEKSTLGVMLVGREDVEEAVARLRPDSFYEKETRTVFLAIKRLVDAGEKVDIVSVMLMLNKEFPGMVKEFELAKMTDYDTHLRLSSLVDVLEDYRRRREVQRLAAEVLYHIPDSEFVVPDDVVKSSDRLLAIVEDGDSLNDTVTLAKESEKIMVDDEDFKPGVKVGIKLIDDAGGLDLPSLTILGAYFGHCKTMLTINMAINAARLGAKVAFMSLEMTNLQLAQRFMSNLSAVPSYNIRTRNISTEQRFDLEATFDKIRDSLGQNIFFDFCRERSIESIAISMRRMKKQLGVSLFFIDHFMLIQVPEVKGVSEENAQAKAGRMLFNLSRELEVAIVVLWQVNKSTMVGHAPLAINLRGSGQPAEAADNIYILYDPHHEDANFSFPPPFEKYETEGYLYLNAAKCRNFATNAELLSVDYAVSHISSIPLGVFPEVRSFRSSSLPT